MSGLLARLRNPDNILGKLAINIIEKRNPGYIQQCIANIFAAPEIEFIEEEVTETLKEDN